MREERDDNPFSWQYDSAGRLLVQNGTLPVTRRKTLLGRSRTTA
ncbi:hypothetical protein EcWSU1_02650 [Enterobacter ludwigii]|uniref:Uncharacterized protein n=1 Tax=Enterobacter ludwigii TaxID=299767 RepID=G8LFA0_9ENTR|nr:hypothetical protein EcWSU1_02650 [Enterobacter ludwigii]